MATDFTNQLLRSVILDQSYNTEENTFQGFTLRRDDVNVMWALYNQRAKMAPERNFRAIENLRTSNQPIEWQVYNKYNAPVGNTRVRRGVGSTEVNKVLPTFFPVVQQGIDMSLVNQALRQYGSEGEDKKEITRRAYADHLAFNFKEAVRKIYTEVNEQMTTWLDTQIWQLNTTPDAGSIYQTYLANAKRVPATDNLAILQNMYIEARENNFTQFGNPVHIASTRSMSIYQDYAANSGQQAEFFNQFVGWFDAYLSNTVVNDPGVIATIYELVAGSAAVYNRVFDYTAHPDSEDGVITAGIDKWYAPIMVGQGSGTMDELPPLRIEIKATCEYQDNSANLTIDESNIDIVNSWSLVTQWGGIRSYDPDPAVSPIIKYQLLSA